MPDPDTTISWPFSGWARDPGTCLRGDDLACCEVPVLHVALIEAIEAPARDPAEVERSRPEAPDVTTCGEHPRQILGLHGAPLGRVREACPDERVGQLGHRGWRDGRAVVSSPMASGGTEHIPRWISTTAPATTSSSHVAAIETLMTGRP